MPRNPKMQRCDRGRLPPPQGALRRRPGGGVGGRAGDGQGPQAARRAPVTLRYGRPFTPDLGGVRRDHQAVADKVGAHIAALLRPNTGACTRRPRPPSPRGGSGGSPPQMGASERPEGEAHVCAAAYAGGASPLPGGEPCPASPATRLSACRRRLRRPGHRRASPTPGARSAWWRSSRGRLELLRQGRRPIHEPGLDEMLEPAAHARGASGSPATSPRGRATPGSLIIAVGTPPAEDGEADLRQVRDAVDERRRRRRPAARSSRSSAPCPPGTTARLAAVAAAAGRPPVVLCPEFLREGTRSTTSAIPRGSSSAATTAPPASASPRSSPSRRHR